jgi:hypothetical protein
MVYLFMGVTLFPILVTRRMKKLAETKYGKYFISGGGTPKGQPPLPGKVIAYLDSEVIKGSNYYLIQQMPITPENKDIWGKTWGNVSSGPHTHEVAELLIHIGTDPDDPTDLGAEVEMCMGEEMEKHVITKSTVVYIPPGTIHCPWTIKRVDRPFIFLQILQGEFTRKSYRELVPEEDREKMLFIDKGYGAKPHIDLPKLRS